MAKKPEITSKTLEQVLEAPQVRAALKARARIMLPRAQRIAAQAGAREFEQRLKVEDGIRPGTKAGGFRRPYARVSATIDDDLKKADAGSRLTRRQILRRSAS